MNREIKYLEALYDKVSQDPGVLERNVMEHPCSSLAGFLLLYHYKKTNHSGFDKLAKKTALHFKNANWLQFVLDQALSEKPVSAVLNNDGLKDVSNGGHNVVNKVARTSEIISAEKLPETSPRHTDKLEEVIENNLLQREIADTSPTGETAGSPAAVTATTASSSVDNAPAEIPAAASGELAFEPLHTVDYFASQGIKITDEPETTDKLGNQMKSFTAWLKSMKKLHPSKLEEQDIAAENQIQNSAEESNINTEILTEAMAEVLIKQDKREKAIEMYNKLSLINPSKRAYFAAKIESIKSS